MLSQVKPWYFKETEFNVEFVGWSFFVEGLTEWSCWYTHLSGFKLCLLKASVFILKRTYFLFPFLFQVRSSKGHGIQFVLQFCRWSQSRGGAKPPSVLALWARALLAKDGEQDAAFVEKVTLQGQENWSKMHFAYSSTEKNINNDVTAGGYLPSTFLGEMNNVISALCSDDEPLMG